MHEKGNITLRRGYIGRGYAERRNVEIPIPPTKNSPEKG
jgi:hypothetical protein